MQWAKIFTSSSNYDSEVTTQLMRAKTDNEDEFDFPSDSVEEQKLKDKVVRENFYKVLMESTEIYYSVKMLFAVKYN